jgi:hypothetical protein
VIDLLPVFPGLNVLPYPFELHQETIHYGVCPSPQSRIELTSDQQPSPFEASVDLVNKFSNLNVIHFFAKDTTVDICSDPAVVLAREMLMARSRAASKNLDLKIVILSSSSGHEREVIRVNKERKQRGP